MVEWRLKGGFVEVEIGADWTIVNGTRISNPLGLKHGRQWAFIDSGGHLFTIFDNPKAEKETYHYYLENVNQPIEQWVWRQNYPRDEKEKPRFLGGAVPCEVTLEVEVRGRFSRRGR